MNRNPTHSRVALSFVIVGSLLSLGGLLYLQYLNRERSLPILEREFPSLRPTAPTPTADDASRVAALYDTLTLTFLIFLTFLVGSFVLIRAGRFLRRVRSASQPTAYVDAWSGYRLSTEDIEAALRRYEANDNDRHDDAPPTDDHPEDPPNAPSRD